MLTKEDSQMSHGLAILAMVALHLFCRLDTSLYTVRLMIGDIPAIYFLGLLAIFVFQSIAFPAAMHNICCIGGKKPRMEISE